MVSLQTRTDKVFDIINYIFMSLILIAVLYPLYFTVISSFSSPDAVNSGEVRLYPIGFTLKGYQQIFADDRIWTGYGNSLQYTVMGTTLTVILTLLAGYALSRKDLIGRNAVMIFLVITMFFGGGLIPTYLLVKNLGMVNTVWALIIPGAVSVYHIIIARTFFQSTIPDEMLEAAMIDGSTNTQFFIRVVLPLSMPIIAVIILFSAVAHWNSYFPALLYIRDEHKFPLQLVLRNILIASQTTGGTNAEQALEQAEQQQLSNLIKYGVIIVSSLPVLILYPFLQRYFVKGAFVGSLKG